MTPNPDDPLFRVFPTNHGQWFSAIDVWDRERKLYVTDVSPIPGAEVEYLTTGQEGGLFAGDLIASSVVLIDRPED